MMLCYLRDHEDRLGIKLQVESLAELVTYIMKAEDKSAEAVTDIIVLIRGAIEDELISAAVAHPEIK